jgi:hypothetical protein
VSLELGNGGHEAGHEEALAETLAVDFNGISGEDSEEKSWRESVLSF